MSTISLTKIFPSLRRDKRNLVVCDSFATACSSRCVVLTTRRRNCFGIFFSVILLTKWSFVEKTMCFEFLFEFSVFKRAFFSDEEKRSSITAKLTIFENFERKKNTKEQNIKKIK